MNQQKIPWKAIAAHLKEEANDEQLNEIKTWLNEAEENQATFKEIVNSWQLTQKQSDFYEPDLKRLWQKLLKRTSQQSRIRKLLSQNTKWIAAAAIVLIVFMSGVWIGFSSWRQSQQMVYASMVSPVGSRSKIVLPDSTIVWLNSGSELRYPSSFKRKTRDVFVSGECYFEVAKNPDKQFVLHGKDIDVKVFGTSFNFKQNEKRGETEVTLVEGKVGVFDKRNRELTSMTRGEHFLFDGKQGIVKKVTDTDIYTAWRKNMIVFDDEPIQEVLGVLESWYGVSFVIDNEILDKHNYTFKVKTESLHEVLDMISVITPIDYSVEGDIVKLKYK